MFLYQEESGFLFNSDSHFLYDFISKFKPKGKVLDIGCGCGILGLLLKRDFNIDLTLIDIQKHNTTLSKQNAKVNNLKVSIIEGDFLSYNFDTKFDLIISNPPYYHDKVSKSQNRLLSIARYNSHLNLSDLIKKVNKICSPKAEFIFCYDPKQLEEIVVRLKESRFRVTDLRFVYGSDKKSATLLLIRARKSSNSLTTIHPPLIHFIDGKLSSEAKKIYQKTRTYSIKCKTL